MADVRPLRSGDPTQVNGYRLTGFIGEGGQGSVYAADSSSGERVAIKLLHARLADDLQAVSRFQREAEATRRVAEFCTARVLDVGALDGRPYIVSEYVEGPSLQHQVNSFGPLTGHALVRLAIATATALAAIHRAGVVHRDFKPSNVLLAPGGPRVIDFGIARALDVSHSLTTSVVGTPAYMAPEQFHGAPEQASDLFAWAGTLVFAATGRPAFGLGPLPAVMHRILTFGPDLSGVPEVVAPLVMAALHKDPRQRPTAEQLLQGLLQPLGRPTAPYPTTSSRGRRGLLVSGAAVATALVVGLTTWLWPRGEGSGVQPTTPPGAKGADAALTGLVNPSDRKGDTLRMATSSGLDSPDPGDTYLNDVWNVVRLYGRSLMMFKPAPGAAGTQVVPDLAEQPGRSDDGGKTWTYTLRRGLKFSDGSPITARDVKHAVVRTLDRKLLSNGPAHFSLLLGENAADLIQTPDDHTIVFNLPKPMASFDYLAAIPQTVPVPATETLGAKYREKVVSSGPYMIASVTDNQLNLVRNPHWDQRTDPNRTALPDTYEIRFGVEQEQIDAQLQAGALDLGTSLSPAAYAKVTAQPSARARTDVMLTTRLRYLAVNPQVAPFDNIDCRKAVFQAVNRTQIGLVYSEGPPSEPATGLLPPTIPGYRKLNLYQSGAGDTDSATSHLRACGRADGFTTTLVHREVASEKQAAEAIQAALGRVGIQVIVKGVPIADFYRDFGGNPTRLKKDKIGLVSRFWAPDLAEPESFMSALVDSRGILEGSSINVSVRLPDVDKLIDDANQELDATRRATLWSQVDHRVMQEAVMLPLVWDRAALLRGARATNVLVSTQLQNYDLLTMGLSS